MKYLLSIIITLILVILLLFNTKSKAFESSSSLVDVPYKFLNATEKKEVDCLIDNIYHEALTESRDGQIAVALVTLNRVKSNVFEKNVCGVVHQKTKNASGNTVCQFSWLCEGKKSLTQTQKEAYNNIKEVALYVYFNHSVIYDLTYGAIYYHADYVSPGWNNLKKTTKIGRHIFYTDPKVIALYDGKT